MPAKKPRILIVEDERDMAIALELKFRHGGFDVATAKDGDEAIAFMKQHTYDYILLDLVLPVKDGFAVLRERRATKNANTPVCVLTALGQESKLNEAKGLGAAMCFVKSTVAIADVVKNIKGGLNIQ